jgi:hypothetical protein
VPSSDAKSPRRTTPIAAPASSATEALLLADLALSSGTLTGGNDIRRSLVDIFRLVAISGLRIAQAGDCWNGALRSSLSHRHSPSPALDRVVFSMDILGDILPALVRSVSFLQGVRR